MVLAALLLAACRRGGAGEAGPRPDAPPPPVRLAPENVAVVEVRALEDGPQVSGPLQARRSAALRAEVGGAVSELRVDPGQRVRAGDVLVAMASSGLHSNGYSLVRAVVAAAGWALDRHVDELGRTLGEELLTPTRLYARPCLELAADPAAQVHAFSHVTGGGLAANLARVLPAGLLAEVDRSTWTVPPVFTLLQALGSVPWPDLESTLNLGVGMVAVVGPDGVAPTLAGLAASGVPAWVIGRVTHDDDAHAAHRLVRGTKGVQGGAVLLEGDYVTR